MTRPMRAVVAACALAMALAACSGADPDDGQAWPEVTVEDLATGEPRSSISVVGRSVGRVSVVTVWAVWCEPCRKELPALQELAQRRQGDLAVAGINHGDDPDDARRFLRDLGVGFPSLRDPDGRLVSALGVASLPATFVVDIDGQVAWSRLGVVDVTDIDAAVDDVVSAAPDAR